MNVFQAIVLGLVQGVTEFLPISSSAHLVLVPWLLGWPEPGLAFDTMVHWGTLAALVAFLWRDLLSLAKGWGWSLVTRRLNEPEARLAWLILVGTIPGVLAGFLWEDFFERLFGSPAKVAGLLLATGAILATSERLVTNPLARASLPKISCPPLHPRFQGERVRQGKRQRRMGDLSLLDSLLIGVAQACAIAPGISRSGATIAMGLLLGLKREAAARYSFLLATPIVFSAGLLQLVRLVETNPPISSLPPLAMGFLAALMSGYLGIKYLLTYLRRGRLYPFAIYCWVAGLAAISLMAR